MYDQYNRKIEYMRISLTDRCNLHCTYCQPDVMQHVPHAEILRYEEILRICQAALALGITKFKITGGEPLLRKGCCDFIAQLKALPAVEQVTLTTNGTLLPQFAPALKAAQVDCVNVSLDTLDPAWYKKVTGGDVQAALQGLDALKAAGIRFKINCVPLEGMGVANILNLLKLADEYEVPLRFIELMPLMCNAALRGVNGSTIRSLLAQLGLYFILDKQTYGNGPATYYSIRGYKIPVGFIEPLHNKFCGTCNRMRLTAVGMLKPCLYSDVGLNLKRMLRDDVNDADIFSAMQEMIYTKPMGHGFENKPGMFNMSQIGG